MCIRDSITIVKEGKLPEKTLDEAVAYVLRLKFCMGLFEHPYVDPKKAGKEVRSAAHVAVARKVAQQSVVLLENKNDLLPLRKNCKIAVIGPNANNQYNMLGDYTAPVSYTHLDVYKRQRLLSDCRWW